MSMLSLGKFSI